MNLFFLQKHMLGVLSILLIYTPTFIANCVPVIIKNIWPFSQWNTPISVTYLGKNKTYRGFIAGVFFGTVASCILYLGGIYFFKHTDIYRLYFSVFPTITIAIIGGMLQSFGALLGDAIKSFIKRKLGKPPGSRWLFFDGIDYILGSLVCFSFLYIPENIFYILFLILFGPIISLIANSISYVLGWKEVWY